MPLPAGLGAAVSVGSGLLGGFLQGIGANKRLDKVLQSQKAENEAARKWQNAQQDKQNAYNSAESQKAREWNRQQTLDAWNRETAYNSPAAQRARMAAAGLNPDLAYGGVSSGNASAPAAAPVSPIPSAGAGEYNTVDYMSGLGVPSVAESVVNGVNLARTVAETKNIQADTAKKEGEITSLDLDNIRKAATNGSQIQLSNMQVSLAKSVLSLNESQLSKLNQEITNLETQNRLCNEQISQTISQTKNLDAQTVNARITAYLSGPRFENECRELESKIGLNSAQTKEILCLMLAKKLNLQEDTVLKAANVRKSNAEYVNLFRQGDILEVTGRQLNFNYEQSTKFDTAERVVGMGSSVLNSVGNIVSDIIPVGKVLKALKKTK